jgi:hypothetical protein
VAAPKMIEDENRLIPQWAIAVIVIGVGGLLFIIVFGVSVVSLCTFSNSYKKITLKNILFICLKFQLLRVLNNMILGFYNFDTFYVQL